MAREKLGWLSREDFDRNRKTTPLPFVDLIILREGKDKKWQVLLFNRETGPWAGRSCTIGGRQWLGETLLGSIARQAGEVGFRVRVIKPFSSDFASNTDSSLDQDPQYQATTNVFPVTIAGTVSKELMSGEVSHPHWYDIENLPENIVPHHKKKILKTVEKLNLFRTLIASRSIQP